VKTLLIAGTTWLWCVSLASGQSDSDGNLVDFWVNQLNNAAIYSWCWLYCSGCSHRFS